MSASFATAYHVRMSMLDGPDQRYSPPRAQSLEHPDTITPKPLSAWLVQALGLGAAAFAGVSSVAAMGYLLFPGPPAPMAVPVLGTMTCGCAVLAWMSVVEVQRRRRAGRWAGAALVLLAAAAIVIALPDWGAGVHTAWAAAGWTMLLGAPALWLYRFAFSAPARAWFGVDRRVE
jgi:hypothetical protein